MSVTRHVKRFAPEERINWVIPATTRPDWISLRPSNTITSSLVRASGTEFKIAMSEFGHQCTVALCALPSPKRYRVKLIWTVRCRLLLCERPDTSNSESRKNLLGILDLILTSPNRYCSVEFACYSRTIHLVYHAITRTSVSCDITIENSDYLFWSELARMECFSSKACPNSYATAPTRCSSNKSYGSQP